jgi:hypothetical protein
MNRHQSGVRGVAHGLVDVHRRYFKSNVPRMAKLSKLIGTSQLAVCVTAAAVHSAGTQNRAVKQDVTATVE